MHTWIHLNRLENKFMVFVLIFIVSTVVLILYNIELNIEYIITVYLTF